MRVCHFWAVRGRIHVLCERYMTSIIPSAFKTAFLLHGGWKMQWCYSGECYISAVAHLSLEVHRAWTTAQYQDPRSPRSGISVPCSWAKSHIGPCMGCDSGCRLILLMTHLSHGLSSDSLSRLSSSLGHLLDPDGDGICALSEI